MNAIQLTTCLRRYWRPVLLIHLFFTLLGIAVLSPLSAALLQGLLALSGNSAVADQDIARLLLSPLGMTSAVLMISVLLGVAALEMGALQLFAQAAHSHAISPREAITGALRCAFPLLKTTLGLTLRILAYLLPFTLALAAIAATFLTEYDINYYLSARPPPFYYAVAAATPLAVLLVWVLGRKLVGWSLVIPLVVYGVQSPQTAFAKSHELTRDRLPELIRAFGTWALIAFVLSLVPALFLNVSTGWLVATPGRELGTLAFLLGATGLAWSALNFLVIALNLAGLTFVIAAIYNRFGSPLPEQLFNQHRASGQGADQRPIRIVHIIACLAAMAVLGGTAGAWLLGDIKLEDDVLVIAHRGAAGAAPENTLASVRLAVDQGADWVEIDVQESRDGQVLVVHDSDFMKLSGNPLKVWEGDAEEIRKIDVGSWFGTEFTDQRVPTLEQVLAEIKGRSRLVIELKYYGHDEDLEQRVIDIVEAADMADAVVVMSLKLKGIEKLQALRPQWTVGLLAATAVGDLTRLDVDFLAVNQNMASPAFIRRAHAAGKGVFVWTINDGLSLSHWMSMGVDGVITDEPALARNILEERAHLTSAERLMLSAATFFGKPEAAKKYRDNSP